MTTTTTVIFVSTMFAALLGSAFFSGIETGILSISRAKITNLSKKGDARAQTVLSILERPDDFYSTSLVANNFANVLVSVASTWYFLGLFGDHSQAVLATMIFVTPPLLIFGEILPKTLFRRRPHVMTLASIGIFQTCSSVFGPASRLIMAFVYMFVGKKTDESRTQMEVRRHEIQALVREGERLGVVEDDEKDMIEAVFSMAKTTVREVMTPRVAVAALRDDMTPAEVVDFVVANPYTRFPVYHQTPDNVVGIAHIAEVLPEGRIDLCHFTPPIYLPESVHTDDALERLRKEGRNMAIVVDEYGGTDGIVTIEDLLEEMVGEIEDEFDDEPDSIIAIGREVWRVAGLASVAEVVEETDLELEGVEFESETIGGLLIEHSGRIPTAGERFVLGGAEITVLAADSRHVETLQIFVKSRVGR